MRDTTMTRRVLLGLAAGVTIYGWPADPAQSRAPHGPQRIDATEPKGDKTGRRPRIVALDAGHGGADPGAISPHGVEEKTITLAMARELHRQLMASGRYHVVLTRRRD